MAAFYLDVSSGGEAVGFMLDFRVILMMYLLVGLISVAKNVPQAVDFLSKRAEKQEGKERRQIE
ncbi:MAG: hypothetical protein H3Z54_13725 [archaeon]|nr:hypothetical protein [archaeon]